MSGSSIGVSSLTTTQATFAEKWGGLAAQAASALGVSYGNVIGQWANESGNGTNSLTTKNNNPGAIMSGGSFANFSTPQAFEQAYVSDVKNDFPGAVNTGSNTQAFVNGLQNGTYGSYFGTDNATNYEQNVASLSNVYDPTQSTSNTVATGNNTAQPAGASQSNNTTTTTGNGSSTWSGWAISILPDIVLIVLGVGLVYIGFTRGGVASQSTMMPGTPAPVRAVAKAAEVEA